jgi:hypothetical protein
MRSAGVVRARHFVAAGGAGAELGSEQPRRCCTTECPRPNNQNTPRRRTYAGIHRTIKTATAQNKTSSAYLQSTRKPLLHARHKHRFNQITSHQSLPKQSPSIETRFLFEKPSLQTCLHLSLSRSIFLRLTDFSVLYRVIQIVPSTGCNLAALARRRAVGGCLSI